MTLGKRLGLRRKSAPVKGPTKGIPAVLSTGAMRLAVGVPTPPITARTSSRGEAFGVGRGLLGLVGVVEGYQLQRLAVDPAALVALLERRLDPRPVVEPRRSFGPEKQALWPNTTDSCARCGERGRENEEEWRPEACLMVLATGFPFLLGATCFLLLRAAAVSFFFSPAARFSTIGLSSACWPRACRSRGGGRRWTGCRI